MTRDANQINTELITCFKIAGVAEEKLVDLLNFAKDLPQATPIESELDQIRVSVEEIRSPPTSQVCTGTQSKPQDYQDNAPTSQVYTGTPSKPQDYSDNPLTSQVYTGTPSEPQDYQDNAPTSQVYTWIPSKPQDYPISALTSQVHAANTPKPQDYPNYSPTLQVNTGSQSKSQVYAAKVPFTPPYYNPSSTQVRYPTPKAETPWRVQNDDFTTSSPERTRIESQSRPNDSIQQISEALARVLNYNDSLKQNQTYSKEKNLIQSSLFGKRPLTL